MFWFSRASEIGNHRFFHVRVRTTVASELEAVVPARLLGAGADGALAGGVPLGVVPEAGAPSCSCLLLFLVAPSAAWARAFAGLAFFFRLRGVALQSQRAAWSLILSLALRASAHVRRDKLLALLRRLLLSLVFFRLPHRSVKPGLRLLLVRRRCPPYSPSPLVSAHFRPSIRWPPVAARRLWSSRSRIHVPGVAGGQCLARRLPEADFLFLAGFLRTRAALAT